MQMPQHFYTWAWALWALAFFVIEGIALKDPDRGDTLSEYVWYAMFTGKAGFSPRSVVFYLVAGFMVWLTVHFVFKGRFG